MTGITAGSFLGHTGVSVFPTDWLDRVEKGGVEEAIAHLSLHATDPGENYFGQGFLYWNQGAGILINALTSGADQLLQRFGGSVVRLGNIIPDSDYLRLDGETQSGWQVQVERVSRDCYRLKESSPVVVWAIPQSSVMSCAFLSRPSQCDRPPAAEMLISPCPESWPRVSQTTYENPHFGRIEGDRDWLEFTCSLGKVVAQRKSNELAMVRIEPLETSTSSMFCDAVCLAFSFLNGRPTRIVASEEWNGERIKRTLRPPRRSSHNSFAPPLGVKTLSSLQYSEALLAKATEFFVKQDVRRESGNLLWACLDSADNSFTTHALVICAAVERLVEGSVSSCIEPQITEGQRKAVIEVLKQSGFVESITGRIAGFLKTCDKPSASNRLRA